ncbi:ferric uptake regulator [Achromatium sp. WMS3]|nr:ferric uptake regulator [Achromatium sp. WMS3]
MSNSVPPNPKNQAQVFLKTAGLRNTAPRKMILDILINSPHYHFSAENLYSTLKEYGHSIGIATIYRVLAQFENAGLVTRHQFGGTIAYFELTQPGHHDHLMCLTCGKIIEFRDDEIEHLQKEVANKHGLTLTAHTLYIFGTCKDPENCLHNQDKQ